MTMLRPVVRAMRARARGSRARLRGVGSTTVRPPACLKRRISSAATCSSVRRRLSRLALKFWRTQPRLSRPTGAQARPLSLAAAGSENITLKSISRCSWGSVMPASAAATAPSTVWICPDPSRAERARSVTASDQPAPDIDLGGEGPVYRATLGDLQQTPALLRAEGAGQLDLSLDPI